jgi:ATP-dependent DNA helicase RecG
MKVLGFVNRFNYGIKRAISELEKSGNGTPLFDISSLSKFKVTIISVH